MKKNSTSRKSGTDFKRLDSTLAPYAHLPWRAVPGSAGVTDTDIDLSDIPEVTPEMFAKGIVRRGLKPITKRQLTLRLDSDVIEWFKGQGNGYQTKMNALLRAYMEEHKKVTGVRRR